MGATVAGVWEQTKGDSLIDANESNIYTRDATASTTSSRRFDGFDFATRVMFEISHWLCCRYAEVTIVAASRSFWCNAGRFSAVCGELE